MDKKIHTKKIINNKTLFKKIEKLEKDNPDLIKAMKTFDMSMKEYSNVLNSIQPVTLYVSNSTVITNKI